MTFDITGMHCPSCGMLIDEELEIVPGVLRSVTSLRRGQTVVEVDADRMSAADVVTAITAAGYQAVHRG